MITGSHPVRLDRARYSIRVFGEFRLSNGDGDIRLSPMEQALVTIVFLQGELSRPMVAELLWSADDGAPVRHRIRQLLHRVTEKAKGPLIGTEGDALLRGASVDSDVDSVLRALSGGRLAEAARLIVDAPVYRRARFSDELCDFVDRSYDALRASLKAEAVARWTHALDSGSARDQVDAAECLRTLDPRDRTAVVRLIEARARVGNLVGAKAVYAQHVAGLDVGADPDPEVEDAMMRVRDLGRPETEIEEETPFVGRADAIVDANRALDAIEEGRFTFVLISGEAGIGKSRLLREIRTQATLMGFRCLSAKAPEAEQIIPLNPLLDALSDVDLEPFLEQIGAPWDAVVEAVLPGTTPKRKAPPVGESALTRRLFDAFARLLEAVATEQPTVLLLDDVHWADTTTVTALQFVQRRWKRGAIALFATVRPERVSDDNAVAAYMDSRSGLEGDRISLSELSDEEARELVVGLGGDQIDDVQATQIMRWAGPHPLYLVEVARDLLSGNLELPDGPQDHVPVPLSIAQIVRQRMRTLSDDAVAVAQTLAVAGRPVRYSRIERVTGLDPRSCAEALTAVAHCGLAAVEVGAAHLRHDLFRSAIYADIPEARRALFHSMVARQLRASTDAPPAAEVALHLFRAGDVDAAGTFAARAAAIAQAAGAMSEAAKFFELAVECESDETKHALALGGLARSLYLDRQVPRALHYLEIASSELRAIGEEQEARQLEIARVDAVAEGGLGSGDPLLARLGALKNEALEVGDWNAVALAIDTAIRILRFGGDHSAVQRLVPELESVVMNGDRDARVSAMAAMAIATLFDDPSAAIRAVQGAMALTESSPQEQRLMVLNRAVIVYHHQGRLHFEENRGVLESARRIGRRCGDIRQLASVESNLGVDACDRGELEAAETLFANAAELLGDSDLSALRVNLLLNRGELALLLGDMTSAEHCYRSAQMIAAEGLAYSHDVICAGLGHVALEGGSFASARHLAEQISAEPEQWTYDRSDVVRFKARLSELQGRSEDAHEMLAEAVRKTEGRLRLANLKLTIGLIKVLKRLRSQQVDETIARAYASAEELRLPRRAAQIRALR